MSERCLVIDGSGYIFRAFYAIRRLSTSKGVPTNAVYGFIAMLLKAIEQEKPTYLAIAFDTGKPTFRKEEYSEYKAHREAPPDDLLVQIPYIHKVVDAFRILRLEKAGFEADDVIATLSEAAIQKGLTVEVITGDKDLMQLVRDGQVSLYDTLKDKRFDEASVEERFGVKAHQIVDFLALVGDSSDNIPGVDGIGEKTAATLLAKYDSLESLYACVEQVEPVKCREKLRAGKESAFLSRRLATVRKDVELDFSWEALKYPGPNKKVLAELFEELEFRNLIGRLGLKAPPQPIAATSGGKYETVEAVAELESCVKKWKQAGLISIDTETTSLCIQDAKLVGISVAYKPREAVYIPVGHKSPEEPHDLLPNQMDRAAVLGLLKPILEDPSVKKVGQNLKYDVQVLKRHGIDVQGVFSDSMLASYLVSPEEGHGLDALAVRLLSYKTLTYDEVTRRGRARIPFDQVPIDIATRYSGEDSDIALRLHETLLREIEKQSLGKLLYGIEVPLLSVLAQMEYRGISVDVEKLKGLGTGFAQRMGEIEKTIHEMAGGPINIQSPKQLSALLFQKLGLPVIRKTKTGNSTDESVLRELCGKHPICNAILSYRELAKLKSTYVEGLLSGIHPRTLRVHTSFNQTIAATGRLSSSNPNLQNIPTASSPDQDIRSVFVAAPGYQLIAADYSQIELRLLAHMSQDPSLLEAFHSGQDIHSVTARLLFKESSTLTPEEQRSIAKTINFGVIYGQTPYGLSRTLGISTTEAKAFIEAYFARYAKVRDYFASVLVAAREQGFTTTLLGRRRYFPELKSNNRMQREMAERAAINAPLQGSAADLVKIAMLAVHQEFAARKLDAHLVLQVHDELIVEARLAQVELAASLLKQSMEQALSLSVPLKVEMGQGKSWREAG